MKKTLLLIAATFAYVFSIQAQDMEVDDIIKKHLEAAGQEKLSEVKSIKVTGKISTQGMELPFTLIRKRPGKMRMEASMQGQTMVQAYNGEDGFMIAPWTGSADPQDINDAQKKQFKEMARIDGKLFNYEKEGTLLLIGKEKFEEKEVYKLELTTKPENEDEDNDISYYYIDAETFVIFKQTSKVNMNGNEADMETYPGNYKKIDSIYFPHSFEQKVNGVTHSKITMETFAFNEDIADDVFEKPSQE